MGRVPRGRWSVAARCGCGLPQVIETFPALEDGTPFPTLWWLTCKRLSSAIGRLESSGWMQELNARLADDADMRAKLIDSTASYVACRDAKRELGQSGHPGGGPDRVKCLHAHVAHHLVTRDNPVGEETLGRLAWEDPEERCV